MKTTKNKCLNPDCTKKPLSRGLCKGCYQAAFRRVKSGSVTWDRLEKSKKCLPTSYGARRSWFLS